MSYDITNCSKCKETRCKLAQGMKIEREHKDLYERIKRGPISEKEFYAWIANAHLSEDPDYYEKLLRYVEK